MRHRTEVVKVSKSELASELGKRARNRAREKFGTASKEHVAAQEERMLAGMVADGYDGKTAWAATCPCGWAANNPIATEEAAEQDAAAHEAAVAGKD